MKTAIKIFLVFRLFQNERSKTEHFIFLHMSKIGRILLIFFSLQNIKKQTNFYYRHILITLIFNTLCYQNKAEFLTLNSKTTKRPKVSLWPFSVFWPYLLNDGAQRNRLPYLKIIYTTIRKILHLHIFLSLFQQ